MPASQKRDIRLEYGHDRRAAPTPTAATFSSRGFLMLKAYLLGAAVFGALDLAARVHAATTHPATREAPDPNNLTTPVPARAPTC